MRMNRRSSAGAVAAALALTLGGAAAPQAAHQAGPSPASTSPAGTSPASTSPADARQAGLTQAGACQASSNQQGSGSDQVKPNWLADEQKYETQREQRQRVADIFAALEIKPGSHVADIGAGRGFFTVRMARHVGPTGRVVAVDVDAKSLAHLRDRLSREGVSNVDVLEGTQQDTRLAPRSLDAALIVNAYHEMPQYAVILQQIRQALKPHAPLVIVEPLDITQRDASRAQQTGKHIIGPDHVVRELREAGFEVAALQDPFIRRGSIDEEWLVVARTPAPKADPVAQRLSLTTRIQLDELKALYDNGDVLVLDVRGDEMYREGHIPGALMITEGKFEQHIELLRAERRLIVTYCSCPAEETSGSAVTRLAALGVTNARALVGGYRLWAARKHPIATGDAPCDGPTCPLKTQTATQSAARP